MRDVKEMAKDYALGFISNGELWYRVGLSESDIEGMKVTPDWMSSNYHNWTFLLTLKDGREFLVYAESDDPFGPADWQITDDFYWH